jgi:hypothetical protein
MKGSEADELQRRRVHAQEVAADAAQRSAHVAEAPQREELDRELRALRSLPSAPMFSAGRGLAHFARTLPGFAGLWGQVVPDAHVLHAADRQGVETPIVLCPCSSETWLRVGHVTECVGECGRWFVATGGDVRVKRFEVSGEG